MPRLLALGHVTKDELAEGERSGGTVTYAAHAVRRLGWTAGVVTSAAPDFDPERELPGVEVFVGASPKTTRFRNEYVGEERVQHVLARAAPVDVSLAPDAWRAPEALLLGPVVGELAPGSALAFEAGVVGACAQGWLRDVDPRTGAVSATDWRDPGSDLAGVHVVFLSESDVGGDAARAEALLERVPIVLLTLGRHGARLLTRDGARAVPTRPSEEVDATGAGDVFAAAFLVGYAETSDPEAAARFACCAAACCVEAVGVAGLGDRAEVERRLALREQWLEDGDREGGER